MEAAATAGGGRVEKEESRSRKGPWTEKEDMQLVCYVGLFGQRRWDFLAKVSGLKRTGKSCRLRWVNYLHPGLKRGRMTSEEERLILQLHARWGNRWSRIARKLPGRTDNEIKNYWRTHMRKKAQEIRKRNSYPSSSSSSTNEPPAEINAPSTTSGSSSLSTKEFEFNEEVLKGYSMDQIWNEIDSSEFFLPISSSPMWDYCPDQLWRVDADEPKMFIPPMGSDYMVPNYYTGGEPYG